MIYYNHSGDNMRFYTAATERMRILSNGNVGIGTSAPGRPLHVNVNGESFIRITSSDSGNSGIEFGDQSDSVQGAIFQNSSDNSLRFNGYNNAERMRITSGGTVGFGTSSPDSGSIVTISNGGAQGIEFRADSNRIEYLHYNRSANAYMPVRNNGLNFEWYLQNGAKMALDGSGRLLIGTTTEGHVNADNLTISGSGHIGITLRSTNSLENNIFFSDGTSGNAEVEGFLQYNHADNSMRIGTSNTERMRITSAGDVSVAGGNLVIGTAGKGIDFSAQTRSSASGVGNYAEILDHYEEGSWTPAANNGTFGGVVQGRYTRVGNKVTAWCDIQSVNDTTTAAFLNINGLPFAPVGSGTLGDLPGSIMTRYLDVGVTEEMGVVSFVSSSETYIRIYVMQTGGTYIRVKNSHYSNAAIGIRLTITYMVA